MSGHWWLCGLIALAAAGDQPPSASREENEAALAVLDGLDQPPTGEELATMLQDDGQEPPRRRWHGVVAARWETASDGIDGRTLRVTGAGPGFDLRARLRRLAGGDADAGVAATLQPGPVTVTAGGWAWSQGFGLAAGAAGRAPGLSADGGLGPGRSGARGWTGWPDPRAARGGAAALAAGAWLVEGAAGVVATTGNPRWLASVGRRDGRWRLTAVGGTELETAVAACGRWGTGSWSGAWEVAAPANGRAEHPATGLHLAWRHERLLRIESLVVGVPPGRVADFAGAQPLLGTAPGTLWAVRLSVYPAPGSRFAVLVAGAGREATARDGPDRRQLADLVGRVKLTANATLDVRLRVRTGSRPVWSEAWPWLPPTDTPTKRSETVNLGLKGIAELARWELRLRSYAASHTATVGRRSMITITVRNTAARAVRWRFTWRQAWGAPVDLADAVSPLPGLLVSRHWGPRSGGWLVACGLGRGRVGIDAAVDLRERSGGGREWEMWLGGEVGW